MIEDFMGCIRVDWKPCGDGPQAGLWRAHKNFTQATLGIIEAELQVQDS